MPQFNPAPRKRHWWLVAALAAVQLTAMAEPIRLGLNYPSTGRYKEQGIAQAQGAMLAVDEINAKGGVLGRPLELVTANTASDPVKAVANVNNMADQGVAMLFGGASSDVAIAAGKEAARHNLIYFGTLTYANETTGSEGHRYMFREPYSAWMAAKAIASWMNERLANKKIYYVTADYSWGNSTEASLRHFTHTEDTSKHGVTKTPFPKPRQTDLEQGINQAVKANADVLVLVQFGEDLATALHMVQSRGLNQKMTIIAPSLTLDIARSAGAVSMEGVIGAIPWSWNVPFEFNYDKGKQFVEAYEGRYGNYPSSSAASAYSIVYQFSSAVERAGGTDSNKLIQALENYSYTGLKDTQTWRAFDHQNVQTVYVVRGRERSKVMADKHKENFFEILSSLPGDQAAPSLEEWKEQRQAAGKPLTLQ
ncbi:ABC transporter substrate-binding protein [Parathalassolituus penaei]|uniref:ABC transporter substrate-binding protein n=1 Tax=Parathalassolituus penaei TaxID=2997323 RepID=A0A9X3ECT9_9GAMM|nr:ABC transporter substrate-binding protein [Parathalassolituus penaei]MCY0965217.1 ABC transporter substrate-binding protein [Parathalassolituus penaei]